MSTAPLELHVHVTVDTEAIAAALDAVGSPASSPPQSDPAVRVKEIDGGAVLVVRDDVRQLLTEFGWYAPVDTSDGIEAD